jgi:cryptochrome
MNETVSQRHSWVAAFEKPNTAPNSLEPSTTVLSPYLKFGCLSPALFYYELDSIYKKQKTYSKPPVSLHGQLLWREYFYLCSAVTPNFDKMVGNPMCRQIDWDCDERLHQAFVSARTGYPFIDACMTQLKQEGWIHHLARHALACFYTRGDLWQSWERGAKVFDELLLDSDWALNNANWQWLSCSRWFYQYFRCYSPVAFGKKTDPNGDYIRRYVPQLAKYPSKYIFEPWNAPLSVQRESGCLIGDGADCGYPAPIVDHQTVSAANMQRMRAAYARAGHGADAEPATEAAADSSTTIQDAPGKRKTIKSEPSAPITSFFNSKKPKTK